MRDTIILSDFDGTITKQDSNTLMIERYGNHLNHKLEQQFTSGEIGTREAMTGHFQNLTISEREYDTFINQEIEVDPGFPEFYTKLQAVGVPLVVISGGYTNAINVVLGREGILPEAILANTLVFTPDGIENCFYHQQPDCIKQFGPCGNCKASHVQRYKNQYRKVIFIGDGLTDRCGAEHADVVCAKGHLAEYCRENGFNYTEYEDFNDLLYLLEELR
ncbi:MAG: HAD-IB family phosphatase [Firmicutes bacterium]|nr:HAD-IB family phosphatase [Bacillota bacterium]